MRLAAKIKMGFYPIENDVVAQWASTLIIEDKKRAVILDPCAGEGMAAKIIADTLGIPHKRIYLAELNEERNTKCRENISDAHILPVCDGRYLKISPHSVSILWLNPPYDEEYGSDDNRKIEYTFFYELHNAITPGGVIGLCIPGYKFDPYSYMIGPEFSKYFRDFRVYEVPNGKFKEVIITGTARDIPLPNSGYIPYGERSAYKVDYYNSWYTFPLRREDYYLVKNPVRPVGIFKKILPLPEEMDRLINQSTLQKIWEPLEGDPPMDCPPMPLSEGHKALLLSSGKLDGPVPALNGYPPHVIRGTATKEFVYKETIETENEKTGTVTTKEIYIERILLNIRAALPNGKIVTITNGVKKESKLEGMSNEPSSTEE